MQKSLSDYFVASLGVPLVGNLRTRLLALHVLEAVLPACESGVEDDQMAQVFIFHYKLLHLFLQIVSLNF